MATTNLTQASSTYLRLKATRGHWHSQEHNPAIDNFNGERHQAMVELQKHLAQVGTSAKEIEQLMGPPTKVLDQPDEVLLHEMKLQNDSYTHPQDTKIWIYEWRHFHDYVYFFLSKEQKVVHSAWYHAYE